MDIFGWEAIVIEDNGRQKKYFIEFKEGFYCVFVQRKKSKKGSWTKAKVVEKSKSLLLLKEDESSEVGLKSVVVA